ncbi:MAG TPA: tetratricopeptide repeat protein [Bryobacteraceae bacterium]|nr:tetratricopeptide repeat protein [Bryobacteraceae bacterium]
MDDALSLLASVREEIRIGQPAEACSQLDDLVAAGPASGEALHLKALLEVHNGSLSRAVTCLQLAIEKNPGKTAWIRDLATVLAGLREWPAALNRYREVLAKSPSDEIALAGYGRALVELSRNEEAIPPLEKAALVRNSRPVLVALGRALSAVGRPNDAVDVLERAVALEPERTEAYLALAEVYVRCGEHSIALEYWNAALKLSPDDPKARAGRIKTLWDLGELTLTLREIDSFVNRGMASESLHAFWLYIRMYDAEQTLESTRERCAEFGRRITPRRVRPRADIAHSRNSRSPGRNLRIGYLTGELVSGPAFYFLSPLIGNHDRREFDVFLYHTRERYDEATRWYSELGNFVDCRLFDDEEIKRRIEDDRIDVLVNASGYFPDNAVRVFAGRAAAVQVAYPNCPSTTGIPAIDYILTDRWTCPKGHEAQYSEQAAFLPSGYLAYAPPADAPEIAPLPAMRNGFVTFGLFQRRAKTNPRVWDAVAAVMLGTPGSRLLLQHYDHTLDDPDSRTRRSIIEELASRGVGEARILLRGARPHKEALACMAEADIALDAFPYQGQTTTCECLWQGVPVVALSGLTHVARVGSALLNRCGLGQLVATTSAEYVRIAVRLASDLGTLARLREGMRDRLRGSTLLDGRNLAREAEQLFRSFHNQVR